MFDLIADPYETNNLYDSEEAEHVAAKDALYALLPGYLDKSTELTSSMRGNQVAFQTWKKHNDFIVPWVKASDLDASKGSFPSDCYEEDTDEEDEEDEEDASSTSASSATLDTSTSTSVSTSTTTVNVNTGTTSTGGMTTGTMSTPSKAARGSSSSKTKANKGSKSSDGKKRSQR